MMKKSKRQKEDHFLRLPDEIIITILTKLSRTHFKFLCQNVSLVSKRFAFLLRRIPTVSISLPPYFLGPLVILEKFVEIHSLRIEFTTEDHDSPNSEPMFLKWKAKSNTKSQTFVFISSTSTLSKKGYKGEQEDNEIEIPTSIVIYSLTLLTLLAFRCYLLACIWRLLVGFLIQLNPLIRSVIIADSNKDGMLCLRDENVRNVLLNRANAELYHTSKMGYLPVLHLPLSGLVMKGVFLVMVRVGEEAIDNNNDDDDDMLNWDFEDAEEKLFGEALTSIFRNHKDKLFCTKSKI